MRNADFKDRLDGVRGAKARRGDAAGVNREEMLMKAQRAEMAAQFDEWASQPNRKKRK
jgi:hypothetical protein